MFLWPASHACGSVLDASIFELRISRLTRTRECWLVVLSPSIWIHFGELIRPRPSVSNTLRDCHVKSCSLVSAVSAKRGAVELQNSQWQNRIARANKAFNRNAQLAFFIWQVFRSRPVNAIVRFQAVMEVVYEFSDVSCILAMCSDLL